MTRHGTNKTGRSPALAALMAAMIVTTTGTEANARNARHIGDSITIGGQRFVIWGSASTGIMPKGASISPDGKHLYVSNYGRRFLNAISVFEVPALKLIKKVNLKGDSIESALSPDGKLLFSTNKIGALLQVFDAVTMQLLRSIHIGGFPKVIAVSPDGAWVYLSRWSGRGISRVSTKTWQQQHLTTHQIHPRGLAFCGQAPHLFVANNGTNTVTVVDPVAFKVIREIHVGRFPRHVACSHDGKMLYVTVMSTSQVVAIDPNTDRILHRVSVGRAPKTVAVSFDDRFVYTADYSGHSMSIVDTRTWKSKALLLDIWKGSGLAVHPSDHWIYVTGWCSDDIWAVERIGLNDKPATPGPMRPRRRICRTCRSLDFMGCRTKPRRPRKRRHHHRPRRRQ
ncbi:MAG: YncE family protein [Deltaproteobacteria bacterium]|nr:YncE family protein [Deltaproteobacteria bacterium]